MWQPIETAPKDGSEVLVWGTSHVYLAWFENGEWWISHRAHVHAPVTHWMPLPAPPSDEPMTAEKFDDLNKRST